MAESWIHDLVALFQQGANEQVQDIEPHLIGHVIEYDVTKNMCRVLLPTRGGTDDDDNDQTMETGWCQMGSPVVGDGWGLQYCLKGGATADNPEQGEQVQVSIQHRASGLCAVANLTFNDTMQPPGMGENGDAGDDDDDNATDDDDGSLQLRPAEFILKHESGSFLKFYSNGDVQLMTSGDLVAQVTGDLKATVITGDLIADVQTGDINIEAELGDVVVYAQEGAIGILSDNGDIVVETTTGEVDVIGTIVQILSPIVNIGAGALFQVLCNVNFLALFNSHVHPTPAGPSGTPTVPAVIGIDTTIDLAAN